MKNAASKLRQRVARFARDPSMVSAPITEAQKTILKKMLPPESFSPGRVWLQTRRRKNDKAAGDFKSLAIIETDDGPGIKTTYQNYIILTVSISLRQIAKNPVEYLSRKLTNLPKIKNHAPRYIALLVGPYESYALYSTWEPIGDIARLNLEFFAGYMQRLSNELIQKNKNKRRFIVSGLRVWYGKNTTEKRKKKSVAKKVNKKSRMVPKSKTRLPRRDGAGRFTKVKRVSNRTEKTNRKK